MRMLRQLDEPGLAMAMMSVMAITAIAAIGLTPLRAGHIQQG